VKEVNKKILLTVLPFAIVLLAIPYVGLVSAKKPMPVSFGVMLTGVDMETMEYRQNGPNWISQYISFGVVSGDIEGSMTGEPYWIFHHWVGPIEDPYMLTVEKGNGHVLLTIDPATVGDKTGKIVLRFNDVFGTDFAGTWVIIGGTGELKGIHGQGTWSIDFVNGIQVFKGKIHFDP
jgi:hypothetical protein